MLKRNILAYIARPAQAVIALILIMFVVLFAQILVTQVIWIYTYEKPSPPVLPDDPQWKIHRASKLFLPDGTLHLVHRIDTLRNDDYTKEEITDVNNNVLWQGISKERPFKFLTWASWIDRYNERQMQYMSSLSPDLSGVLEIPVRFAGEIKEVWRYDIGADVFSGYEVGGNRIGYLGAAGFADSTAQVQPFGEFKSFSSWTNEDPSSVIMLWQTKQRIYQVDFRSRKVDTVFDSGQADINSIRWHQWRPTNPRDQDDSDIQYRPLICCQTTDNKCHLIMHEPNEIITVEMPGQWRADKAEFTAAGNNVFLKYNETPFNPPKSLTLREQYINEYNSKPQPQSIQLYKVAGDGKLEVVNRFDWTRPVPDSNLVKSPKVDRWEIYQKWISKASPPMFDLLWYLFGDALDKLRQEGTGIMREYAGIIIQFRPSCTDFMQYERYQYQENWSLRNYLLSAVAIGFTLWHGWARRTSWARFICWLVIVALFGIAGLLTYLALNHTPVIKCPVCGKKRGLEKLNCIRCGNALPTPQRKPTDLIMAS
jgi:hypothetical protein